MANSIARVKIALSPQRIAQVGQGPGSGVGGGGGGVMSMQVPDDVHRLFSCVPHNILYWRYAYIIAV